MARYSKNLVQRRFEYLCKIAGKSTEAWTKVKLVQKGKMPVESLRANIGAWVLDSAPEYGGFVVHEMVGEGGAVHVVNQHRMKAAEFIGWMDGVEFGLKLAKPRTFRLLGRATVFKLVKTYMAAGDIPSVKGVTLDGKHLITEDIEKTFKDEDRTPDMRRCERVTWLRHVLDHASDPTHGVKCWENRRGNNTHVILWVEEERFVVVLAKRNGYYLLKTMYQQDEWAAKKMRKEYEASTDPR